MHSTVAIKLNHNQSLVQVMKLCIKNNQLVLRFSNYIIAIELSTSTFPESGIFIDYTLCKQSIKEIIKNFNQKILISRTSAYNVEETEESVTINYLDQQFVFPINNCLILSRNLESPNDVCEIFANILYKQLGFDVCVCGIICMKVFISKNPLKKDGKFKVSFN